MRIVFIFLRQLFHFSLRSVSINILQVAGTPESFFIRLQIREIVAMGNICPGKQACKKKIYL